MCAASVQYKLNLEDLKYDIEKDLWDWHANEINLASNL